MSPHRPHVGHFLRTASMLRRIWVWAFVVGLYAMLAVWKELNPHTQNIADFPSSIFTILGLTLSIVLVFRTNRAYDRWWEARTLWGTLVNISRNLAIKISRLADLDEAERADVHRLIAGFAFALKNHLRDHCLLRETPGWTDTPFSPVHVPAWLSSELYRRLDTWQAEGRLTGEELIVCDSDARVLLNVCGGCERIRNTLIAGSYRAFSLKCLVLYLLALPWGLVHDLQWVTVPITMIMAYIMVGLEAIADDVEQPFGFDLDDLDLEQLCHAINVSVAEILSVEPLPETVTVRD